MSDEDGATFGGRIKAWRAAPDYSEREEADDWRIEAACRDADPELFFPHKVEDAVHYAGARLICAECTVTGPCLEYALSQHIIHGMWGMTTPTERRAIQRERRTA